MKLFSLFVLIFMAQISLTQKCNFSYCLRCGYSPKTNQNSMVLDAGSRAFTFGYGSGQGSDWQTPALVEFQCQLCDAAQSYFLNPTDGTCVKIDNSGPYGKCALKNINGGCLLCSETAYYNPLIDQCVDLVTPLPNCTEQSQDHTCLRCYPQYYFNSAAGICTPVFQPDVNCLKYSDAITCVQCAQKYSINPANNKCVANKAVDNCYINNMLSCNSCKTGFGLDYNRQRMHEFDLTNELQRPVSLIQLLIDTKLNQVQNHNTIQCFTNTIGNCTEYTNSGICKTCAAGFYVSSTGRSCMMFPAYFSTFCSVFALANNVLTCTTCKTGYKLNAGTCVIFDEYKLGCNYYKTSDSNDCLSCETGYYLVSGACVRRTNTILYCAQYAVDSDECSTCLAGYWYRTSNTFKGCIPVIPYCVPGNHTVTNPGTAFQIVSCTLCVTNYLLTQDGLGCGPVTTPIQNCQSYNKYNYCDTCQNGFLISTQCAKTHSKINNCQKMSQLDQNECRTCRPNSFKRTIQSYCYNPKVAVISNCTEYSFILQRCVACATKFRLSDDGNMCIANPANCLTFDNTTKKCTACDSGYALAMTSNQTNEQITWICVTAAQYKTQNCSIKSYVTNGVATFPNEWNKYFFGQECDYCLNQTLPAKGKYQCFSATEQNYLQDYNMRFTPIDKCVKYSYYVLPTAAAGTIKRAQKLSDFTWTCEACDSGYWLYHNADDDAQFTTSTCLQNQASNITDTICWYGKFVTSDNDKFVYRQNTCEHYPTDTTPVMVTNQFAYLAPNIDSAQLTTFTTTDTTVDTYYTAITNDSSTVYTINDCITSANVSTVYYKVFTDLALTEVSNVSANTSTISSITHPLYTNIGFNKCIDTALAIVVNVDGCKYYAELAGGLQYCVACKDNFTGLYNTDTSGDNLRQILSCTPNYDPNFNVLTAFQNIKAQFGKFLSIKKCTTVGSIPIIQLNGNSLNKIDFAADPAHGFFKGFTVDGNTNYVTSQANYCMPAFSTYSLINSLSLAVPLPSAKIKPLPANCAYGLLNTYPDATTFDNSLQSAATAHLLCLQCKPGYKPTYAPNGTFDASFHGAIVTDCTLIQFCNLTTNNIYLDACGQCADGFAYEYDYTETVGGIITTSAIKYNSCVWAGSQRSNCIAVIGSGFTYGLEKNASLVQTTVSSCVACKKGFSMSYNRKSCVQESVAQCSSGNYVKTSLQEMSNNTVEFGETHSPVVRIKDLRYLTFYLQGGSLGCNQCSSGFVSIYKKVEAPALNYPFITTTIGATQVEENKYIYAQSDTTTVTQTCASQVRASVNYDNGIPFCQNYQDVSGVLKCKTCVTGYVVKSDYTVCYPSDQLTNCLEATDEKTCSKCIKGNFILLNGATHLGNTYPSQCIPQPIANCETFNDSAVALGTAFAFNGLSPQYFNNFCIKCLPGYYRNAFGQCTPGPVPKCLEYTPIIDAVSQPKCSKCMTGFHLLRVPVNNNGASPIDDAYNCVPINTNVGCNLLIANYGYSSVSTDNEVNFNCRVCDSPFTQVVALNTSQIVEQSILKSDCLSNFRVPNCLKYESTYADDLVLRTTLQKCVQCQNTHFLKSTINGISQCFPRKFFEPSCQTFNLTEDKCITCREGRYLTTDGTRCIQFPAQTENCIQYKDKVCTQCYNPTNPVYLSADQCVLVPTANIVKDCRIYSNQTTCIQCNTKFYLSSNVCTAYDITNCTVQTKQGICDTCDLGYAFSDSTKATCVSTTVTNCDRVNQDTKLCSLCSMGYFLKADGSCGMANLIPGCLKYDSLTTCLLCEKQLFLDQTRTQCKPNAPELQRCESTNALTDTTCAQCMPTYKLVDGKCVQPVGDLFDLAYNSIKGCLIQSQRNPILCEVCQSGFTMNSTQTCEESNTVAPPVTPITPTDPNKPKSAKILEVLFKTFGLVCMLLLFQYYYYIYNSFFNEKWENQSKK